MNTKNNINKVAILGSGVMGGQIAALFANANIATLVFDNKYNLDANFAKLRQLKPAAFITDEQFAWLTPCNYDKDLSLLGDCELVIESIIEDMDAKRALFKKISPYLAPATILATNTSSLSINQISSYLLVKQQQYFCGIHFFNPPRYLTLVELIAASKTKLSVLNNLENFLTTELGKNVIYANDSVGFIANRVGVFAIACAIRYSTQFKLGFDTVDALTGNLLHRSKSATFRTADLVGLDILVAVLRQFYNAHKDDPWRNYFYHPNWLDDLIKQGHLGSKAKQGIYYKKDDDIYVYRPEKKTYEIANYQINKTVENILKQSIKQHYTLLKKHNHPQAQFVYHVIKDIALYSAYHLDEIASSVADIDWTLRFGFGWRLGVFEYWQANGVQTSLNLFSTTKDTKLVAPWLGKCQYFYQHLSAWSPKQNQLVSTANKSSEKRQLKRPYLLGQTVADSSEVLFENTSAKCWCDGDNYLIFSLKTKLHTFNLEAIQALNQAIDIAEDRFAALIIWQEEPPFCAGANLYEILVAAKLGMVDNKSLFTNMKQKTWNLLKPKLPSTKNLLSINEIITLLQQTFMRIKYSKIPTIAAAQGLALGGGCELLLHCDCCVLSQETYMGLVEIGVGLLPAGGGCREMASRADGDFNKVAKYFTQIGLATVATSSKHGQQMGYLRSTDIIITQAFDLLYIAKRRAKFYEDTGYRPPNPSVPIKVAGSTAKANILSQLANMAVGNFISEYDYFIAEKIADVLCGGDLVAGSKVDNEYLLDLEREHFLVLLKEKKTLERIEYMLIKHKPLRN